ncbi:hypothetical protein [Sphingomonas crusticola]|uniref:hypothetical protein n=1 Tax=Sphingomonas crusticola TaxID=1697973 RepID=UPI000E263875|nr:hypothetical protein [Sphingomonas crusticola]
MSFRYKSALLSLVSLVLIYGWFFVALLYDRHADPAQMMMRLAGSVLLTAAIQIVGHIIIALTSSDKYSAMDERERGFDRRGTSVGYYVLILGALCAVATLHLGAHGPDIGYAVVLAIVLAECARQALFLVLHHKAV